jgi:hypothetical protein
MQSLALMPLSPPSPQRRGVGVSYHGARHRMGRRVHAVALQFIVFPSRRAGRALRFGHQPPLRFGVLLLLASSFLVTLLKARARFFCHGVPSLPVSSRDCAPIVVLYEVSRSPALARRTGPMGATPLLLVTVVVGAETHRSGVAFIDGVFRSTLGLRDLLGW